MKADSLRFLVPISYNSIKDERGNRMRQHGNLIKRTFKDNLGEFVHSVQPVVTKCTMKDKVHAGALRQLIGQILQKEIVQDKLKMEKGYRDTQEQSKMDPESDKEKEIEKSLSLHDKSHERLFAGKSFANVKDLYDVSPE